MPFTKGHPFYKGGEKGWIKKGQKLSMETRRKMSLARKDKPQPWNKGRKHTMQWRKEMSKKIRGSNHWNWQGGKSLINDRHDSDTYKKWRMAVYQRDNFTCQFCGIRKIRGNGVILHADHIKPFSLYLELRFELSNGRTLCVECHKQTPTWGGRTPVVEEVMSYV